MGKEIDYEVKSAPEVVDAMLRDAIEKKASDIHIDPGVDGLNIRFRIDGVLNAVQKLGQYSEKGFILRIKIMGRMDIAEPRLPQDGRFEFECEDKKYNIRVSTFPTIYGEATALRILNYEDMIVGLGDLGLEETQLIDTNKILASPYGIILVTGPTGSGKTTFLYSALSTFNKVSKNVITLEDPVELSMGNVRQIQIEESIGLGFAKAMRGVVRQDPDVIMLGEIRDVETAQMAFQAALTGILMLSTFHTFDVSGLVIRLIEMGVPRSVVAHAVAGIISTRLVRKVCPNCAEPYTITDADKVSLGTTEDISGAKKGKGCDMCQHSGYLNRIGIFEVVHFNDEIRTLILGGAPPSALREFFKQKVPLSLRASAINKVKSGVTTVEEVARVVGIHDSR